MKKIIITSLAAIGVSALALGAFAHPGGKGERGFDRLDTNGDGKITAAEMEARQDALIAEADSNRDGAVSREEMRAFRDAKRAERRAARNPDKNGDGVVDRLEFTNAAAERFDRLDKNGDGVLSDDERPNRRGHHRRGRQGD